MNNAFKALSDPTRRRILKLLSDRDMTAGEIAEYFEDGRAGIGRTKRAEYYLQLEYDCFSGSDQMVF